MTRRTGSADLPLHGGYVPQWLSARMAQLGRVIVEAIALHYGRDEVLRRLAHPFWFQSFGAVMGMDWHSSGVTTSVIGALKRGLAPIQDELGIYVCGGKGAHARRTPLELSQVGERTGLDADPLTRASRLVAKVDSAAVQDGFDLYLHAFVVSRDGRWCIVQQGMNASRREARRYHWLSEGLESFLDSPHAAIEGRNQGAIVNLADARAARNRTAGLDLVAKGPDPVVRFLKRWRDGNTALDLFAATEPPLDANAQVPHLQMPSRHDVRASDVMLKRLHAVLAAAADRGPKDFAELLLMPGVGARTVAALALVAEVVYGAPSRFADPARFSFAHGGKDGHPFPVPLKVYDETIRVLKDAVSQAKLGNDERLAAIRRLDKQARMLERIARGPRYETLISKEWRASSILGGRMVGSRGDRLLCATAASSSASSSEAD
ncbi:MAG: DUF763 domain-containing protein [Gammaproteobacteria bacterium]|nr:DUF763 domain-containing protein [Gammaproteobacteria bacterium]